VTIHADDVTDPAVLSWMTDFQAEVLREHGYQEGDVCSADPGSPELCPALSLTDLLGSGSSRDQIDQLLAAVPPYFLQSILTPDRRTANLAFGIRLMPLDRQQEVIEDVRSRLDPPPGVRAALTGLPVLAAEGNAQLSAPWRRMLVLGVGLAAVFLVLLAVRRRLREAAVPLIPIALATGWAGLILFVLGIPLNPMSAALGAVVIAISTEFSVLLSARYREERDTGVPARVALERAYGSTGAAVLASGVTATAGFAVLIASDIQMLRDFGLVTVVGLGVSLLGVMLALPAALVWADRRQSP
jgi:predicted RND superfamily exporter protein